MVGVIEQSFRINLLVMRAFWLYPSSHHARPLRVKVLIRYLLLTIPVPLLGILYFLLEENIDKDRVGDDAFLITELLCYFFKMLPFTVNGERIKNAIHYLEAPLFSGFNDKQKKIVAESVRICKRNSRIFLISAIVVCNVWACKPLFGKRYQLPIDLWLPFDVAAKPAIFYVVYLLVVIAVFYLAYSTAVIDPLIGGLACLTTGQLKVLKDNLQYLDEYSDEKMEERNNKNASLKFLITYKKIGKCVDHHNAILDFVKLYEKEFTWVAFSQFMGSIVRVCICCWQLSTIEPVSFNFLSILSYVVMLLIQLYFYCYYGTALYEESSTLTNAAYSGRWYEYDIRSRKALVTFMERAQKPMAVTAGKVMDLSLVTFTMVLRRSYSLLAVLKNY